MLACSLSHQRGSPRSFATCMASSWTIPCGLNIASTSRGDAASVVSQGHSGAAHDEYVCHDASADEALAQRGECPFKLCPAEEDTVGLAHAASRSLADKSTPCLRN